MKPQVVDEMFPEGGGPYMELEEVILHDYSIVHIVELNHCFFIIRFVLFDGRLVDQVVY